MAEDTPSLARCHPMVYDGRAEERIVGEENEAARMVSTR